MPQPIMKKYKQGEFCAEYGKSANEKLDRSMMKTYSQGEFSDAGGKSANPKPASWSPFCCNIQKSPGFINIVIQPFHKLQYIFF